MPYFVYLEFSDPKLRDFLRSLREVLNGEKEIKPAHITVRGPYDNPPDPVQLEQLKDDIQGCGVIVGGADTFVSSSGFVVYLKVQSPAFKKIWWKPDYNVEKYGINPHITIFETSNRIRAMAVEKFLRRERIEIFTFSTVLTVNMSKQSNLFETNIDSEIQKNRSRIIEKWAVKPGIMQRAIVLRESLDGQVNQTE